MKSTVFDNSSRSSSFGNILQIHRLFLALENTAYLQYQLQITDRKQGYDESIHENQKSIIRLPMPMGLIKFLSHARNLPNKEDILDYIHTIKEEIDLPYLSVVRIETALHIKQG